MAEPDLAMLVSIDEAAELTSELVAFRSPAGYGRTGAAPRRRMVGGTWPDARAAADRGRSTQRRCPHREWRPADTVAQWARRYRACGRGVVDRPVDATP